MKSKLTACQLPKGKFVFGIFLHTENSVYNFQIIFMFIKWGIYFTAYK